MKEKEKFILKKFLFGTISRRMITAFIVVAIVLTVFGTSISYINTMDSLTESIYAHLETTAQSKASHIETWLDKHEQTIGILASSSVFENMLTTEKSNPEYNRYYELTNERLNSTLKVHDEIFKAALLDENGVIVASTDKSEIDMKNAEVIAALKKEGVFIKDAQMSKDFGVPYISYALPITDDGNVIGGIMIDFDLTELYGITTDRTGLRETGEIYLINKNGYMITPSRFTEDTFLKQKVDTENARTCFEDYEKYGTETGVEKHKEEVIVFADYRGVTVIGTHSYIPEMEWCLLAEIDESEALGIPRGELIKFTIMLITVIILFASITGFFIARKISRPIEELQEATKKMEKGDFSAKVDIKTGDELEQLGRSLNKTMRVLEKTESKRKQLEHAKTELLSITSHELRSPMTPMKAQLQMLLGEYFGKLTAKQKESVEIVLRNTERLDDIITDFLEISRIEAARLKFKFVKTDLKKELKKLVDELKGIMPEKDIKIILNVSKLPNIEIDPDRVGQVLRNLIENAMKFSSSNSKIHINVKQQKDMILFSVKDQGIGLSQEEQRRIFEPFFQAEQTIYRKYRGTGLGLTICKGIVQAQGGELWVESEPSKGSTFYFTLPMKPVREPKSVKLLFSQQKDVESAIRDIFIELLGPMGTSEFEKLQMRGITSKNVMNYMSELKEKGIINDDDLMEVAREVATVFGIKESLFKELKTSKISEKDLAALVKRKDED